MYSKVEKSKGAERHLTIKGNVKSPIVNDEQVRFEDNRPELPVQKKLKDIIENNPQENSFSSIVIQPKLTIKGDQGTQKIITRQDFYGGTAYKKRMHNAIKKASVETGVPISNIKQSLLELAGNNGVDLVFDNKREAIMHIIPKERVRFAKKHSDSVLGGERLHTHKPRATGLIAKMKTAKVTFNFDYGKTSNWKKPQMLNSFEVLKNYNVMAGNLKDNVDTRDEIENQQFGIPRGMNENIAKIDDDKEKAKALNKKVPPNLRPKYAALNFAGYNQGAAPSKYYGMSHMIFANTIKARCTITGGDSLGDAGSFAGLAFPLTNEGIEGLVEYCYRKEQPFLKWKSLDTQGQDEMDTDGENADNPDFNFIEVQIHGDVNYKNEVEKIVIASSELGDDSAEVAISNMKRITGVQNVVVE
ncbi:MAG: DUF3626 domain-containing protein [Bacteroidales bacterium]|nr:DUF3626 domain-containing protein [Bacteroidales bacterium]